MKEIQYILCNTPDYFNQNDINNIEKNYKKYIFPKKKLLIKFFKYNTFFKFITSLQNEIKLLNFEKHYSPNLLLIDGRILSTSKLKNINESSEKIYNIPLNNSPLHLKKNI